MVPQNGNDATLIGQSLLQLTSGHLGNEFQTVNQVGLSAPVRANQEVQSSGLPMDILKRTKSEYA